MMGLLDPLASLAKIEIACSRGKRKI